MTKQIETYIEEYLSGETKKAALEFVKYLKANELTFYKDTCECWKDKVYYWVKLGDECVCFIAIKDPHEPNNFWTVWSNDSSAYEDASISDEIKNIGWQYVDHCGNCGSCDGGKEKVIFGKSFPQVCGCTFRIDNAAQETLPFLKAMVCLRIRELQNNDIVSHSIFLSIRITTLFTTQNRCGNIWTNGTVNNLLMSCNSQKKLKA